MTEQEKKDIDARNEISIMVRSQIASINNIEL